MSTAPAIDEGNPSDLTRVWALLVGPTPGRLENTIRAVVLVLAVVAIGEVFRLPEIAISAYIVLFVSRAEAASSVLTALIAGVTVILAIFAAILVLIFSLSQPALRIPLIAGMSFTAMFLARTAGELAPAFFAAGFIIAYGLTLGEEARGLSLVPGSAANTESFTLPELELLPTLTISYLLLDFGGRQATINAARQLSVAVNVAFTGAHQKLILAVAKAYFLLGGADAALRAAEQALKDAEAVQNSAEASYRRGLATIVTVELARRDTAQRRYTLAQARTAQHEAQYGLLTAMDLPPTTQLRIVDVSTRPLPQGSLQQLLSDALRQRPDLIAGVAKLRASDEAIALPRSALWPTLSLSTNIQGNIGQISVDGLPYTGVKQYRRQGCFLNLAWPLYRGGVLARSRRRPRGAQSGAARSGARLRSTRYRPCSNTKRRKPCSWRRRLRSTRPATPMRTGSAHLPTPHRPKARLPPEPMWCGRTPRH